MFKFHMLAGLGIPNTGQEGCPIYLQYFDSQINNQNTIDGVVAVRDGEEPLAAQAICRVLREASSGHWSQRLLSM